MDYSTIKQVLQSAAKPKTKLNVRLVIFSFFFIVAFMLWYLNKLTYEYTTEVRLPLRIVGLPKGKVLIGELPKSITVQIRDYGYTLLRYKLSASLNTVILDLTQLNPLPLEGSATKHYLLASRARGMIAAKLKEGIQIGKVSPDTLFFEFTRMAQKKVKVIPTVSYSLEKQHMQAAPMSTLPDSITISGPSSIVDTIKVVHTQSAKLEKLTGEESIQLQIKGVSQVSFSHRLVRIIVPVERFTEAVFKQNIEVINCPDSIRLVLIPKSVEVKGNVLLSQYKNFADGNLIKTYVDYKDSKTLKGNRLRVNVESPPYYVNLIDVSPRFVEVIIEKN